MEDGFQEADVPVVRIICVMATEAWWYGALVAAVIGIAGSGPLAEPVHSPYTPRSVGHVVPPVVELLVPHVVQLILFTCLFGAQPLHASLPARGCLGPPRADCSNDRSGRRHGATDGTGPGQRALIVLPPRRRLAGA